MTYLTMMIISWVIPFAIGLYIYVPVLWRKYVTKHTLMDDGFGIAFFLILSIPIVGALVVLLYIFYLTPLYYIDEYMTAYREKNKEDIECPHCGNILTADEYKGESFHTSNKCPKCGNYIIVSKTEIKNKYITSIED